MATSPKGRFVFLPSDHPLLGTACSVCGQPITGKQTPTVIGDDPPYYFEEGRLICGVLMNAPLDTVLAHESCVYPDPVPEPDPEQE